MGINANGVPVKAYNFISIIKWYHGPLWCVYQIIIVEIPNINKDIVLQMMLKAINDTISLNGLVFILLVFGTYPWMVKSDILSLLVT